MKVDLEVVTVPAQPVLDASTLLHQVSAVIDEQAHVESGTGQMRLGKVRLAQRGTRHTCGVDRVGLAVGAGRGACTRHHLGRYAHHALTPWQQMPFEPARDVTAVLDREVEVRTQAPRPEK